MCGAQLPDDCDGCLLLSALLFISGLQRHQPGRGHCQGKVCPSASRRSAVRHHAVVRDAAAQSQRHRACITTVHFCQLFPCNWHHTLTACASQRADLNSALCYCCCVQKACIFFEERQAEVDTSDSCYSWCLYGRPCTAMNLLHCQVSGICMYC